MNREALKIESRWREGCKAPRRKAVVKKSVKSPTICASINASRVELTDRETVKMMCYSAAGERTISWKEGKGVGVTDALDVGWRKVFLKKGGEL